MIARTDLAIERDALGRFLPWIVAFMVYLASLALAGVLALDAMAQRWDHGVGGTLTVQLVPVKGEANDERIEAAIALLRETPQVARVQLIEASRIMALLEPWLGGVETLDDLPLPILIDVEVKPGAAIDRQELAKRLQASVPGTSVDDHRIWLEKLVRLIRTVQILALAIFGLALLACIGTVIFTTRTGLAIHHEAIEVLHLIGAQDSYVARQFAGRALSMGLRGGLLGVALAIPTLIGLVALTQRIEGGLMPEIVFSPTHWTVFVVLPVLAGLIAMLTARLTVMGALARMP
ncbi:MAG: cell division protein [Magnetospirillum sp. WYHS-4]